MQQGLEIAQPRQESALLRALLDSALSKSLRGSLLQAAWWVVHQDGLQPGHLMEC